MRKILISLCFIFLEIPLAAHAGEHHCPDFLVQEGAPEPSNRGEIVFSPYTHHWSQNPEHKNVVLLAAHEHLPGGRLCGMSVFSNSFGQPSAYVYVGQEYDKLFGQSKLYLKVTAGILYGYVGEYKDKVPLNAHGFSPAIIPALGYHLTERDSLQVQVLGTAGVVLAYGRKF